MKNHRGIRKIVWTCAVTAAAIVVVPQMAQAGTAAFDKAMQPILEEYLKIQAALAGDSTSGVQASASAIGKRVAKLDPDTVTGEHAAHYKGLPEKIKAAANAVGKASGIEEVRSAFKELSKPMAMWGTMSKPKGIDVVFCSMAKGSWLQKRGEVRNPYYGSSMLTCGEVVGGDAHHPSGHGHGNH